MRTAPPPSLSRVLLYPCCPSGASSVGHEKGAWVCDSNVPSVAGSAPHPAYRAYPPAANDRVGRASARRSSTAAERSIVKRDGRLPESCKRTAIAVCGHTPRLVCARRTCTSRSVGRCGHLRGTGHGGRSDRPPAATTAGGALASRSRPAACAEAAEWRSHEALVSLLLAHAPRSADSNTVDSYGSGSARRTRMQRPATHAHTDTRRGRPVGALPPFSGGAPQRPRRPHPYRVRRDRRTLAESRVLLARATMKQRAPAAGGRQAHRRSTPPRRCGCRGADAALVAAAAAGVVTLATVIAGAAAQSASCSAYLDMTCFYPRVSVQLVRRPATRGRSAGGRLGRRWCPS